MFILILAGCSEPESAPQPATPPAAAPRQQEAADPRPVILAFGDSLTAGHNLPPGSGYPEQLQELLDIRGHRYRVVNAGVSGETSGGGLGRLQSLRRLDPSIVILELGANDGLQGLPVESLRSNLDEIITAFRQDGARIVLAGMTLPRNFGPDYIATYETVFPDLARKHKIVLIPFFLEGAIGHTDLMLDDGIHPNEKGYRVVAELVLKYLEPML